MAQYVQFSGEADVGRGQSFALWNPYLSAIYDIRHGNYSRGVFFQDDFIDFPDGKYTSTVVNVGATTIDPSLALDDAEGGELRFVSGTQAGVNNGINLQLGSTTGESFLAAPNLDLVFECRVKAVGVATLNPRFFVGLGEIDTTLMNGTSVTAPAIGFRSTTNDKVVVGTSRIASTSDAAALHTLVNNAYVKLGFRVIGTSQTDSTKPRRVEYFVDGVKQANVVTTNIPTTLLVPSLVWHTELDGGEASMDLCLDWWQALKVLSVE